MTSGYRHTHAEHAARASAVGSHVQYVPYAMPVELTLPIPVMIKTCMYDWPANVHKTSIGLAGFNYLLDCDQILTMASCLRVYQS